MSERYFPLYKNRMAAYNGRVAYTDYIAPFTGPFDSYTINAGYSMRRLRSLYTGDAIIVKRSSDNATQSIGFDSNGDLNQTSLTSFVGAGDGYIVNWYDQSGNNYHLSLGTYSVNGPQIVTSGVVATMSGASISRPTIKWSNGATNISVLVNTSFSQAMPSTNFSAVRLNSTTLTNKAPIIYDSGSAAGARHLLYNSGKVDSPNDNWGIIGSSGVYNSSAFNTTPKLLTALFNGASSVLRANGTQIISGNTGAATHTGLKLGNLRSVYTPVPNSYQWEGDMSEMIFFNTDRSANYTAIESIINAYWGLY